MMEFRQSGPRDDRRRRVLHETVLHPAEEARPRRRRRARKLRKSPNYGDAEFMDEQPRLTDFVPLHLGIHLLLFLAGLAVIAGLEFLYAWMPSVAGMSTDGRVATLDLDDEGSLAVWFSSMTLAACAMAGLIVYFVRRHRADDYHGRYRVWLWAVGCWLLMSLDETASLHEGFKEMMSHLAGTRLVGDGSVWWVAPYFFLLGGVGIRVLVDMRQCWLSSSALVCAAVCYALAVVSQLGIVLPDTGARGVMFEEGAEMLGNLALFAAVLLYARHVILDAEGLLAVRADTQARADEQKTPADADEAEAQAQWPGQRTVKIHPPHGAPSPARPACPALDPNQPEAIAFRPLHADEAEDEADDDAADEIEQVTDASTATAREHKPSKAERRALRKKLKQQTRDERRLAG